VRRRIRGPRAETRQKRPLEAAAAFKAAVMADPTLEVAKRNVHPTVSGLLTAGGGGLLGIYAVARLAEMAAKGTALTGLILVGALVLLILWLFRRRRERLRVEANRDALERLDPQIFEIDRRLESEKKWRWKS
jgi:hypothetical protein